MDNPKTAVTGEIAHLTSNPFVASRPRTSAQMAAEVPQPMDNAKAEALWQAFDALKTFDNVHIRLQRGNAVLHIDVAKGATFRI